MASQEFKEISVDDLTVETVKGVGKASGKPYIGLRFKLDVDGVEHTSTMFTFINPKK